ncbi:hypothetical protein AXG93_3228s1090 [Marchantia polymorpha subsp. ruderalis]|uniref:NPH3 domain-containing protein n=1 Tax=Marchantia polymorpha subsp. ruderalis TaxID=1480154 RepID=A0A176WJS6_MARPO|nr:hypothetical protein AXG93_3228s1090 [Marchantia polymorpha subsp. ruderalis]
MIQMMSPLGDSPSTTMSSNSVHEKRPTHASCNLEVGVNGEEVFRLHMLVRTAAARGKLACGYENVDFGFRQQSSDLGTVAFASWEAHPWPSNEHPQLQNSIPNASPWGHHIFYICAPCLGDATAEGREFLTLASSLIVVLLQKPLLSRCGLLVMLVKEANTMRPKEIEPAKSVLTVELENFPGGPEAFELAAKFCYNEADVAITVSNVATLRCVAEFLQMTEEYGKGNLLKKTESFLKHEVFWNWNDSLAVLKTCETFLVVAEKADIIQRCANALASRASLSPDTLSSPSFSSESHDLGASSGSNSSRSSSKSPMSGNWWFHDFSSLSVYLMERVVRALIKNGIDHKNLAKFLLHYLRSSIPALKFGAYGVFGSTFLSPGCSGRSSEEEMSQKHTLRIQQDVIETVVDLLSSLQPRSASCRSLFSLLRIAVVLSASKTCRKEIERMIGVQLDKATLDNILVPALPRRSSSLYDVDLIVRLAEHFLQDQAEALATALLRVGELIDKNSSDGLYRAVEIFLEAHPNLSITEATGLCKVINLQKLGVEACKRVAQNTKFPASFVLQVVLVHQNQLRSVMDGCIPKELQEMKSCKPSKEMYTFSKDGRLNRQAMVVHLECSNFEFMVRQNQELKTNLKKIHSRVAELESTYKRLRLEMGRLFRAKRRPKTTTAQQ